jgi:hypothetical protein
VVARIIVDVTICVSPGSSLVVTVVHVVVSHPNVDRVGSDDSPEMDVVLPYGWLVVVLTM